MLRKKISNLIEKSIKKMRQQGIFPDFFVPEILIAKPEEKIYGDYSTNIAMTMARQIKRNPMEIAKLIIANFEFQISNFFDKIEAAEPGFINFFLSKKYLQKQVNEVLRKEKNFGNLKVGKRKKINLEFISANPTGPLTLGNGRGGFCGDVLANVLERAGYKIIREYYINDAGEQVKKLGHSVIGDSEAIYKGDYILTLRKKIKEKNVDKTGEKAAKIILKEMIKPTVKKMGIKFDVWFSEKNIKKKEVNKILEQLKDKNLTYEKEGALWFKSTDFGDDKDRVLIKADGQTTYFASDIAYLENKFKRGFDSLIFFWGADHHGYIERLKAAAQALGRKKEQLHIIITQFVRLFVDGKETRMAKRKGVYVTLDELIDEVGLDVSRFFFLTRNYDTHLNFDLDLAKERSAKNPVYYIQYAYARICSIIKNLEIKNSLKVKNLKLKINILKLLNHPSELEIVKQLIRFPEIVEDIAKDYQVQRLSAYALDLATDFHQFYRDCQVLTEDRLLQKARIGLILATKIVLKNTLDLMGISAPKKM